MTIQPIEIAIGQAAPILAEGRLRAKRDQVPMMEGLKRVITEKLKTALEKANSSSSETNKES